MSQELWGFLFLCVLNHLIHTPLQETGAIINSCFTNEEAEVPSLKNTQEVIPAVSESKLGPRHYGPSNFTINHYSTLPLKNSGKKSFFFFFTVWPLFLKEIINKDQFYHSFISWILSLMIVLTFLQFRVCVSCNKSVGLESRDEDDCNLQKWHIKHVIYLFIYILGKFLFWIQSTDKNTGRNIKTEYHNGFHH